MPRKRILIASAVIVLALSALVWRAHTDGQGATRSANPRVGQCRILSAADGLAASNATLPIPCSKSHTAQTFAVPMVAGSVHYETLGSAELNTVGLQACEPQFWKVMGRTATVRDQSAFSYAFFVPTKTQRANGARWVRCDLTMRSGGGFLPLPATPSPVLKNGITSDTRRCMDDHSHWTNCSSPHSKRATTAFVMNVQAYQTHAQFVAAAAHRCPRADTFYTRQQQSIWDLGDHVIVCYRATTS